jgi:hypothetical protein
MSDYTARAREAGWTLPDGWTVTSEMDADDTGHPRDEHGHDCYDEDDFTAYDRGDWGFVYILVTVRDAAGRKWGASGIGGVEAGTLAGTFLDPLSDEPGEYSPVREYDLIGEALRDAVKALETFGDPHGLIREPAVNWSGI